MWKGETTCKPIKYEKTKPQTAIYSNLACAFEVCSLVLNFTVIGQLQSTQSLLTCN